MSRIGNNLRPRNSIELPLRPSTPGTSAVPPTDGNLRFNNSNFNYIPAPSNDANVPLKKSLELRKSFLNQIRKYCESSTLHGLGYVGNPKLTYGERIFWFISFSLAIAIASYYISLIYTKWNSSPVLISFSPVDTDISTIPFPAVTICNMNQARKNEADKILKQGSDMEKKLLDDSCGGNATFNDTDTIEWRSLRNFLIRVGQSCSDLIRGCQWGGQKINCSEIFNNELTDEGLCCAFNRMPPEIIHRNGKNISRLNQTYPTSIIDWDPEDQYGQDDNMDMDYLPRRPMGAGVDMGLSVTLDLNLENYFCSSGRSTGFKVSLSNPIETAQMADDGILIMPGFETRMSLQAAIVEATEPLRKIPVEKRQCFFSHERPLRYYRKYSETNCRLECMSIKILERCGCVPYYLPRDEATGVCFRNDQCAKGTIDLISKPLRHFSRNASVEKITCDCHPRCFRTDYTYFMTDAPLKIFKKTKYTEDFIRLIEVSGALVNVSKKTKYSQKFIRNNFAKVTFFFDSTSYTRIQKMPLYNFTDLVAYTGGLLGFFIGFSFLSVIEIFFHILWTTWRQYKKNTTIRDENDDLPPPYTFVN